jgi:hypothetical protein
MGAPINFLRGPSHFLVGIFLFFGQSSHIKYGKIRVKLGNQLQRTRPEKFFPKKLSTGGFVDRKKIFSGKILNRGPQKIFAPGPRQALGDPG